MGRVRLRDRVRTTFSDRNVVPGSIKYVDSGKCLSKENRNTIEVNGCRQLSGLPRFFQISSFVFSRRKKLIQVLNNLRENK